MKAFCTIITQNYFPYAVALYKSIRQFDDSMILHVFVADSDIPGDMAAPYPGIRIYTVKDVSSYWLVDALYKKYAHISMDNFRWALKPVFITYLLEQGNDKVLYTDCDVFFINDYAFLFNELNTHSVLLTPHWRNSDPLKDAPSFLALFSDGIYNAGFIGAAKKGLPALHWWANACHYRMETNEAMGLREDQGYLDLLPVNYEDVLIIRHRGCNVSAWNQEECKRVNVNGEVLINGTYPIVFIHFSIMQFEEILKGHDALLLPYLNKFRAVFEEDGVSLSSFHKDFNFYHAPPVLLRVKWKLRIRTRVKRLLFLLAKKL